jgi:lipoate-protein ligase A
MNIEGKLATSPRPIAILRERFPGQPVYDTALSHAMLRRVAAGALPESLRLYAPENVMLFSSLDARRPGYGRAVERAEQAGFGTALRLAGGHAAAFLEQSMAFAWAIPSEDSRKDIRPRFERLAALVAEALQSLGLDARIGELPGEYCPGEYSVNLGGRVKVMGVGQRVIRGAAHVGGVLTIGQSEELRASLVPVYDALDIEFRPETAGGIADFDPSIGVEDVIEAHLRVLESWGHRVEESRFDEETRAAADELAPTHEAMPSGEGKGRAPRGPRLRSLDGKTLLQSDRRAAASAADSEKS